MQISSKKFTFLSVYYLIVGAVLLLLYLTDTTYDFGFLSDSPVVKLSDSNFSSRVIESDQVVLVDFWAKWCGPCRVMTPVVSELAEEYEGRVIVAKLDVDSNEQTAQNFNVRSIPYFAVFKDGQIVEQHVGSTSKSTLAALIDKHLE